MPKKKRRPWTTAYTERLLRNGNDYADFEAWERWMNKDKNCKRVLKEIGPCNAVVIWDRFCRMADEMDN